MKLIKNRYWALMAFIAALTLTPTAEAALGTDAQAAADLVGEATTVFTAVAAMVVSVAGFYIILSIIKGVKRK